MFHDPAVSQHLLLATELTLPLSLIHVGLCSSKVYDTIETGGEPLKKAFFSHEICKYNNIVSIFFVKNLNHELLHLYRDALSIGIFFFLLMVE